MVFTLKKITNRKQQSIATRKHILETALGLISQDGFDNITIQDICTSAGVSVGAFYHYFNSKEEIILACYGLSDDYFETEVLPRLERSNLGFLDKAAEFAREQVGFGMDYGKDHIAQLYRAQITHNSPDFFSGERGLVNGLNDLLTQAIEKGQLPKTAQAEQISHELLIITRGVILDWIWGGNDDPQELAAQMVKQHLNAIISAGAAHGKKERH